MAVPASFETVKVASGRFTITILPIGRGGCEAHWNCEDCGAVEKVEGIFESSRDARDAVIDMLRTHRCRVNDDDAAQPAANERNRLYRGRG